MTDDAMEFVCVEVLSLPTEAAFLLVHLRDAEIPAYLSGELTAATFTGNRGLGSAVSLFAARDQLKRARDIIATLRATPLDVIDEEEIDAGVWVCSLCGEGVEEERGECPYCGTPRRESA